MNQNIVSGIIGFIGGAITAFGISYLYGRKKMKEEIDDAVTREADSLREMYDKNLKETIEENKKEKADLIKQYEEEQAEEEELRRKNERDLQKVEMKDDYYLDLVGQYISNSDDYFEEAKSTCDEPVIIMPSDNCVEPHYLLTDLTYYKGEILVDDNGDDLEETPEELFGEMIAEVLSMTRAEYLFVRDDSRETYWQIRVRSDQAREEDLY